MPNKFLSTIYFIEARINGKHRLLCRIVEHFYDKGKKVQMIAHSDQMAQVLDKVLWSFSQDTFIPHKIATSKESNSLTEPVIITVGEDKLDNYEILIYDEMVNLEFANNYSHIIHFVVTDDPDLRNASRSIWKKAKENNIHVQHIGEKSVQKMNFGNLFRI